MKPLYIHLKQEYIPLLLFLYPDYALLDNLSLNSKFIIVKDVCSPADKNTYDFRYHDCIFVSSRVFDEQWDEEILKAKFIEFARTRFKSRKKTLKTINTEGVGLIEEIKRLIFVEPQVNDTEESPVLRLFHEFGSANFSKVYFQVLQSTPFPVVRSSLMTFIQKVIAGEQSLFYRKKNMLYGQKIRTNFINAYCAYRERIEDYQGLSFLKFIKDLTR